MKRTIRQIARRGDPGRALAALFAPRGSRDDLFGLYAFDAELARIQHIVSEPALGAIRLQWWREAIERAARGEPAGHPVADAFGAAISRRSLSRTRIAALIDARGMETDRDIMPDLRALSAYLDDTESGLFALAEEIVGEGRSASSEAVRAAGEAYGLTALMRALPHKATKRRVDLPEDLLARHGTSPEEVLAGEASDGLRALLASLRTRASDALKEANRHIAALDPRAREAFRPLALVEPYLAALESEDHDPLRHVVEINPLYRIWRIATWR
ncbi:MAG: phytoene/squalene synthase family protein [Methyloceanibacter sp.]